MLITLFQLWVLHFFHLYIEISTLSNTLISKLVGFASDSFIIINSKLAKSYASYEYIGMVENPFGDKYEPFAIKPTIHGDELFIGVPRNLGNTTSGSVLHYKYKAEGKAGQRWEYVRTLEPNPVSQLDYSTSALATDEGLIVAATLFGAESGTESGELFAYEQNNEGDWSDVDGTAISFGSSNDERCLDMYLKGSMMIVGVYNNMRGAECSILELDRESGGWQEKQRLKSKNNNSKDFCSSIAVTRNGMLFVGAPREDTDGFISSGAVYAYMRYPDGKFKEYLTIKPPLPRNAGKFGTSLATTGNVVFIGEIGPDKEDQEGKGKVYIAPFEMRINSEIITDSGGLDEMSIHGTELAIIPAGKPYSKAIKYYSRATNSEWQNTGSFDLNNLVNREGESEKGLTSFGVLDMANIPSEAVLQAVVTEEPVAHESSNVRIFMKNEGKNWEYIGKLTSPHLGKNHADAFGAQALFDETAGLLLVSAPHTNFINEKDYPKGPAPGAIYVFEYDDSESPNGVTKWKLSSHLTLGNEESVDRLGSKMYLNQDTLLAAAHKSNKKVFVYERNSEQGWDKYPTTTLTEENADKFGSFVYKRDNMIIVGAIEEETTGACFIYEKDASNEWNLVQTLSPDSNTEMHFCSSAVILDNGMLVVGAPHDNAKDKEGAGRVYFYERNDEGHYVNFRVFEDSKAVKNGQYGKTLISELSTVYIGAANAGKLHSIRFSYEIVDASPAPIIEEPLADCEDISWAGCSILRIATGGLAALGVLLLGSILYARASRNRNADHKANDDERRHSQISYM